MSNYSDPITATGSLITFDAPSGGVFDSLSVPITPTQDLHGYSSPWPAGGGKNICPPDGWEQGQLRASGSINVVSYAVSSPYILLTGGQTYTLSRHYQDYGDGQMAYHTYDLSKTHLSDSGWKQNKYAFTPESDCYIRITTRAKPQNQNPPALTPNDVGTMLVVQLERGSTATSYAPYSNICPISGRTGLSVFVGPTTAQADATTYAVDWTSEAGTVYGGTDEVVGGVLTDEWAEIPSYNGETITEPWLSSMDEYAPGATPTTGAQVVYKLATPLTYQLTPTQISMLVGGQNNVWVDTSAVITMIYRLLQVDRQTGATSIGRLAQNLLIANQFGAYSKVIINVNEELYYEAGDDTGRTFELTCPFGTQAMANNILAMLEGFQYQPYTAERAIIDPAAELGDGLTVNGVYGGIFRLSIKAGAVYNADVSSPADEEIDHEYAFIPNAERKIDRRINNLSSELLVQADQISAKVSQTGGNSSSFSWQLLSSGFLLNSGNNTVFQCNSSGIKVTGQVNATSGYIGNGSAGFLISSRSISNGKSSLSDGNYGVYIGTDGIALGPNFKVDSSGNLTANSGTFTGAVYANQIQTGGNAGYITGGQIGGRTISVGNCSYGINTSLGNADYAADVFSGAVRANYGKFYNADIGSMKFATQTVERRRASTAVSGNMYVLCAL